MGRVDRHRTAGLVATVLFAVVAGLFGAGVGSASADTPAHVSAEEAAELARDAVDDHGARRDLASVTRVDGDPVGLEPLLDADEAVVEQRLAELAALWEDAARSGSSLTSADELRATADDVLDADKFHERSVPRPFRGLLRWVGEVLSSIYRPFETFLAPIVGRGAVPWIVLGIAGALAAFLTRRFIAARSRAEVQARTDAALRLDPTTDPDALEAAARDADVDGDHGRAIRLRHQAGLLRLARRGHLDLRPDTTARGAARAIGDPRLDELTDRFEAVVYGDQVATARDGDRFRTHWADVLADRPRNRRTPRNRVES